MEMTPVDRRRFLTHSAQLGLSTIALPTLVSAIGNKASAATSSAPSVKAADKFCAFTESFQEWPIPKVCQKFREIGLDGLDLTVRPGGHIKPEDAEAKLPDAFKAAEDNGVKILMLTTGITDADKNAEAILEKCAEHKVDRIKLGYFPYKKFGSLLSTVDAARAQISRVAKLASKYNVLPCVHIHSGPIVPSSGTVGYLLFKDFKPGEVGAYVDPMHMTAEGGLDGWRQGLDLLAPWISLSSVKNSIWMKGERDKAGQQRWEMKKCPLADGMAPLPDFLRTLRTVGYGGLFSLGSEYVDNNSWKVLTVDECLAQTAADLKYAKSVLASLPAAS
jgi:sugar phosphate isomerase/epimerase